MIIGIDFRTCFSSAAIMNGLIPVTSYVKDTTGEGVPSLFMYSAEKNMEMYGEECTTGEAFGHSADIVRYMKRTVRENPQNLDMTIRSGGKDFAIGEVIEKYLTFLVSKIREGAMKSGEFSNNEIEAVTITAPVGISSDSMMASDYNRLLQDCMCRITNLPRDKVRVLQEPVAAAISYLYSEDIRTHYDDIQRIMVFDLGGGTLDVTIVEHNPKAMTYEILAKEGDLQLGGNDWDDALRQAILNKLGITEDGTDEEKAKFLKAVTKLKMDLSNTYENMVFFTMGGEDKFCKFSREEFEDCTEELLDRAMVVVDRAIDSLGSGIDINKIVLVGGSSNMPQIKKAIDDRYGLILDADVQIFEPSKAIAKGAAIFSKMTSTTSGNEFGGRVIDCATVTYGFESHKDGGDAMIYNMIYKSTPFDDTGMIRTTSDSDFIPMHDDQTLVAFDIYESEHLKGDSDWFALGQGETYNGLHCTVQVPPEFLGKARGFSMWVSLTLDTNGILDITVRDRAGNRLAFASSRKTSGE